MKGKGSRILVAGIAILAVIALSAIAGYRLIGAASDHPTAEPPAGRSPSGIKTTLQGRVTNAWDRPAFHLKGLDERTHRLDEWKDKVIMLNFWATWCGPCQYEIRDFVIYQERYAPQGLQIIGMGLDEERKLRNVARTLGINYPVLVADPVKNPGLLAHWGNPTHILPYTVVIDRDGRLKYIHRGRMDADAFEELVLPLLAPAGR
jgi:thiol-disulfide isomerase/thioredoxin